MTRIKQLWYYLLIEPLIWIRCAFFQPITFKRDFEKRRFTERIIPMLRLVIPMFLVAYPLALLLKVLLIPSGIIQHRGILDLLLTPLFGIVVSIVFGIMGGIMGGIVFGIALGIALGIVFSIVVGIVFGIAFSIVFSIVGGIVFGIVFSIVVGIVFGIVFGIMGSIAFGLFFGSSLGVTGLIEVGMVSSIACIIGLYRIIPFYIISAFSSLITYQWSENTPSNALLYLQRSALYWDELIYLPLPYLKHILLLAYDEQPQETLEMINFIAVERPLQLRAARAAMLEIIMRDLEMRINSKQIAEAAERLESLLPKDKELVDARWTTSLARLKDASREALRSTTPIGVQGRTQALDTMLANLQRVYPNVPFRDQRMNVRLKRVVETWQAVAQHELAQSQHAAQELGRIDNPYKPGQVLSPHDALFTGRRDLAPQLEAALSKGSRRPTLLLNGERRMGKTSTLFQLPYLLGSRYVPVFYNLQNPAIYASTTTFLGSLADGIQERMQARGFPAAKLSYRDIRESGSNVATQIAAITQVANQMSAVNDAYAYRLFSRWLASVEQTLEQEDRILLLTFDEFEKLEEASAKNFLDLAMWLDWCREIIQFHPRIALLFSGVKTIDDMGINTPINWSSYLINVQMLRVSFLTREEAHQLICTPTPNHSYQELFGPPVVERIISETGCHPFLIQAVCSALIDNLNVEKRDHAELSDAERAVNQAIESWKAYFKDLWIRTDEEQRTCLKALISLEHANLQQLQQHTTLEEKVVRRTLQALVKRDLVRLEQDGNYVMAVPMFTKWVKEYGE